MFNLLLPKCMVCLCVCHDCKPSKNSGIHQDAIYMVDSCETKEPCRPIRWAPLPIPLLHLYHHSISFMHYTVHTKICRNDEKHFNGAVSIGHSATVMCLVMVLHRKLASKDARLQKDHVTSCTDIKAVQKYLLSLNSKAVLMCVGFF